jgi:hypothetical protein
MSVILPPQVQRIVRARSTEESLLLTVQTSRVLGLTVPPTLLATADEVIE